MNHRRIRTVKYHEKGRPEACAMVAASIDRSLRLPGVELRSTVFYRVLRDAWGPLQRCVQTSEAI